MISTLEQIVDRILRDIGRFGDEYPHNGDGLKYVLTARAQWQMTGDPAARQFGD